MTVASSRKKSAAYEQGLREGRADKAKKPTIEIEINPEGEEESPDAGEEKEMDSASVLPKRHSRERSAKNAHNTKAPMDGDCGCMSKGPKGKASCDGSCGKPMKDGGYAKKMDRNDALTPQEYLKACELGIQNRSRAYIRARLDSAARLDLKCGAGSISEGEKCTKGTAQKAGAKARAALEKTAIVAGTAGTLYNYAQSVAKGMSGDLKGAGRALQRQGAFAALTAAGMEAKGRRTNNKSLQQQAQRALGSGAVSAAVGSTLTGDLNKVSLSGVKSAASNAASELRNTLGRAAAAKSNVTYRTAKSQFERMYNRPGRRDSVWAEGFIPNETHADEAGTKVASMETKLRAEARRKGLKGEDANAYVYGTLNKMGYKDGNKTTRKGAAKAKRDMVLSPNGRTQYLV